MHGDSYFTSHLPGRSVIRPIEAENYQKISMSGTIDEDKLFFALHKHSGGA
ncbi:MAG TPA: hypothetical protein VHN80_12145 [Kineosporiaceae bacterium]|nr:hypothetical protein [Kineosporiaceae bacterium]